MVTRGDATTTVGSIDMMAVGCVPQMQDCPAGQKCAPYATTDAGLWDAARCVPVVAEPAALGDPCEVEGGMFSGLDNCDVGAFCWDGEHGWNQTDPVCVPICTGPLDGELTCPPGYNCSVYWDVLTVCELPSCDPVLQDCLDPAELCSPNLQVDDDWCVSDESGPTGALHDPCEMPNSCDKGLVCMSSRGVAECDQNVVGCCEFFCELGAGACPGVGEVCAPYFNFETVGVCQHL